MDSRDTPPLAVLVVFVLLVLAAASRSASYLFATLIDGARKIPSPDCFFAALRSLLYMSLEGGAGRGGATFMDRLFGTGGEGSVFVVGTSTTVGAGVVFLTGRLVRGGTGGIGLLGAPRLGVLGDCGVAVLVGGAVSASAKSISAHSSNMIGCI
jgi:hypothetical protein